MSSKRFKILFITKWYPNRYDPQFGVFIRKHADAVSEFCDVALLHVCSDNRLREKSYEIVAEDSVRVKSAVVYFKKHASVFPVISKLVNFFRYCRATLKGLEFIRKNFGDHDITHAYILLRPALVAYYLKLFNRKPFVISEQWSGFATGKFEKKIFFEKLLTRFVIRKADAVTVVSQFLKDNMQRNGLDAEYNIIPNIIRIPGGVNHSGSGNKIKMLTVADLVDEIKNVSGTIRAISEIISSDPGAELHIVGEGKDRGMLEKLASSLNLLDRHVFFHGIKSNEEVYSYLQDSDFLVMNSNFETFSLICAEAMSCGKPVVATRCGGPQEFVTPETGILVNPGNHKQLVDAMRNMMSEYRNYDPEKLRQYVFQKFSSQIAGEKFYKVYTTLLNR